MQGHGAVVQGHRIGRCCSSSCADLVGLCMVCSCCLVALSQLTTIVPLALFSTSRTLHVRSMAERVQRHLSKTRFNGRTPAGWLSYVLESTFVLLIDFGCAAQQSNREQAALRYRAEKRKKATGNIKQQQTLAAIITVCHVVSVFLQLQLPR